MTSNLQDKKWAVLSERGCEATELTHEEARRLVHRLEAEGRHGLCIVSNDAAARSVRPQRASDLTGARDRT